MPSVYRVNKININMMEIFSTLILVKGITRGDGILLYDIIFVY